MENNVALPEQNNTPENLEPENNSMNNMATLLANEGLEIDFPKQGEIKRGVIASISQGQILVSVGTKSEGIISGREYEAIPADILAELKVGQEISVFVINPEDQNGNLVLSFTRAREEEEWLEAERLQSTQGNFTSKVIGYNKGGLIVPLGTLRGFVPASQISLSRRADISGTTPDQRFGEMVGSEIEVSVIEVDRSRRRLILSERAASTETRESLKERVIDDLTEGDIRKGRVTSLADFGAFVNISGADGLVHLSEISWDHIDHPKEALKVGEEVDVKIITIDREKRRIGLSIRQLLKDPWSSDIAKLQVGQLIEGTITRLTKFGAFARLHDDFKQDIEGLIHISEISEKRIEHPKEVLKEGDVVTLRVIRIEPENHRIGLSLRKVESMAYADMDWQTLLDEANEEEPATEESQEPAAEETQEPAAEEVQEPAAEVTQETASEEAVEELPVEDAAPEPEPESTEDTQE